MSTFLYVDTIVTCFPQPFQTLLKERLPSSWPFHGVIWLTWTWYCLGNSARVLSP